MVLSLIFHKHCTKIISNRVLLLVVLLYLDKVLGQLCKPRDCYDVKCYRVSTANRGVYIYPNSTALPKLLVTCDQIGGGGGWIVYLRRFDGSLLFNRTFAEYKNGFGQQGRNKESWLGNEKVHQLDKTFKGGTRLRIQGFRVNGTSCVFDSDNFKLEGNNYRLKLGRVVTNHLPSVGDWRYHNNRIFTARDSGRTTCVAYTGGWWYADCHKVYLTGYYPPSYEHKHTLASMFILNYAPEPLTGANMLIRPMVATACNNPCKNNAGCEYVESTNNYHCVCPETHCGLHCENDNPCKNNGTCVYSPKTKDISCVCDAEYTGNLCNIRIMTTTTASAPATATAATTTTTSEDTTTSNVLVIIVSLMLLFILLLIAACVYLVSKKKARAREEEEEEEERGKQEEEEEREAEEDEENPDDTMFGFMSDIFS